MLCGSLNPKVSFLAIGLYECIMTCIQVIRYYETILCRDSIWNLLRRTDNFYLYTKKQAKKFDYIMVRDGIFHECSLTFLDCTKYNKYVFFIWIESVFPVQHCMNCVPGLFIIHKLPTITWIRFFFFLFFFSVGCNYRKCFYLSYITKKSKLSILKVYRLGIFLTPTKIYFQ